MTELRWDAEGLQQALQAQLPQLPQLPSLTVEVVARCASTNTVLIERARAGNTHPCLLLAEEQTHGRGRMGRTWQSAHAQALGSSLTFSLALPLAPKDWQGLSLAVGVALATALDSTGHHIGLKWPNDLWLLDGPGRGRKLAGTLIETVASQGQRVVVVGVGINVLPQPDAGTGPTLSSGYACLAELNPAITAAQAWHQVLPHLVRALLTFEASGLSTFVNAFSQRDLLCGQTVLTTQQGVEVGHCEGINEQGALLVRDRTTQVLHAIHSGEVSVRPLAVLSSVM